MLPGFSWMNAPRLRRLVRTPGVWTIVTGVLGAVPIGILFYWSSHMKSDSMVLACGAGYLTALAQRTLRGYWRRLRERRHSLKQDAA